MQELQLLKSMPRPEVIYAFLQRVDIGDLPQRELEPLFEMVVASIEWCEAYSDFDATAKKAVAGLKKAILRIHVRMEKEHVPEVRPAVKFLLPDKPNWEVGRLLFQILDAYES